METQNENDLYCFDSTDNYKFYGEIKEPYKIIICGTTNASFLNFGKSSIEEKIFDYLKDKEKMKRLRILIFLK